MIRGFPVILPLLMLLPACQGTVGDCKPFETVDLSYPKSFETTRKVQADGRTAINVRVKEYTEFTISISYDQIARTERWVPHESPAALPISRAIELATQWVARERSDEGEIRISSAYLKRYGCRGEADHWYYGVTFSDHFEGGGASVVVLMDGTVIGPVLVK